MLGCGRLTTKLGSGSSVGYIWCIRLSPLAWYLAQSVARLYTCLLPSMRGLQFLLQFFLVFESTMAMVLPIRKCKDAGTALQV